MGYAYARDGGVKFTDTAPAFGTMPALSGASMTQNNLRKFNKLA